MVRTTRTKPSAFEPISEEERACRKALMERMLARRNE